MLGPKSGCLAHWLRVDPTTAISRERIDRGMSDILPRTSRAPLLFSQSEQLINIWKTVKHNRDAVNKAWNRSILAYGPDLQKSLTTLCMVNSNWQRMTMALLIASSVVLLMTSALLLMHSQRN